MYESPLDYRRLERAIARGIFRGVLWLAFLWVAIVLAGYLLMPRLLVWLIELRVASMP